MGSAGYKINLLDDIRSKYILKKIFENIQKKKSLNIIKYNKNIQERLEIGIDDYEKYGIVEIEIIPIVIIKSYRYIFLNQRIFFVS